MDIRAEYCKASFAMCMCVYISFIKEMIMAFMNTVPADLDILYYVLRYVLISRSQKKEEKKKFIHKTHVNNLWV